jgi:alkylation response protein AidB-like acyl-CoA dehydrogenase
MQTEAVLLAAARFCRGSSAPKIARPSAWFEDRGGPVFQNEERRHDEYALGFQSFGIRYKGAARAILPRLAATSDNSECLRRLDDSAAAALRESGLSRVITPKKFGGFELSPSAHIWACAELGRGLRLGRQEMRSNIVA